MPESKNNFIKAKMNQDLDDRLVPKGEYRVGQNVTISRSEGDDVGTFQNVLGNTELSNFNLQDENLEVIGYTTDDVNNNVYIFITNYSDSSFDQLTNFAPPSALCAILLFNLETEDTTVLSQGNFLNFSKTQPVNGVNLIENLLFFTDNRNQPRKINVTTASGDSSYYNTEDKISVAKFYPHQPINFYDSFVRAAGADSVNSTNVEIQKIDDSYIGMQVTLESDFNRTVNLCVVNVLTNTPSGSEFIVLNRPVSVNAGSALTFTKFGLKNCSSKFMATEYVGELQLVDGATGEYVITGHSGQTPVFDLDVMYVTTSNGQSWTPDMNLVISSQAGSTIFITNETSGAAPPAVVDGTRVNICRLNPDYNSAFSGDSEFLKDKFIRFSYRFKFDDDEYSLMAPFTQPAFIPNNFGSFVDDNESVAAKSSVLKFWENWIDCIDLNIPSPLKNTIWSSAVGDLNISEVQIVCKFSDEISIKVIDNLDIPGILKYSSKGASQTPGNNNVLQYQYLSQKPIRTLPEKEISRVSDQVPIRALSQESAGNRIIYGNFYDKHSSPEFLNFKVGTTTKADNTDNRVLYSHSLKQNRTYQVGIVLSDRYGRQSDVILSSVQDSVVIANKIYGGATTFNPYADKNKFSATDILNWYGDQIILYVDAVIPDNIIKPGYPGLYTPDNPLGWFSYKIVVKQQEQDYYNVYLPGAVQEEIKPVATTDPNKKYYNTNNSYFSLVNDNINKIPKDLDQSGGNDMEFRASERVFPRVDPRFYSAGVSPSDNAITSGEFVETSSTANIVSSIFQNSVYGIDSSNPGEFSKVNIDLDDLYKSKTALVAEMNNKSLKNYGINYTSEGVAGKGAKDSFSTLGVLETKPSFSNLDIYYESSTSGLVSDLNIEVQTGNPGVAFFTPSTFTLFEDLYEYQQGNNYPSSVTGDILKVIEFQDQSGSVILDPNAVLQLSYAWSSETGANVNIASDFQIVPQLNNALQPNGRFLLYSKKIFYFSNGVSLNFTFDCEANNFTSQISFVGNVSNRPPKMGQGVSYNYDLQNLPIGSNTPPYSAGCYYRSYPQSNQLASNISDFSNTSSTALKTVAVSGTTSTGYNYNVPESSMKDICHGGTNMPGFSRNLYGSLTGRIGGEKGMDALAFTKTIYTSFGLPAGDPPPGNTTTDPDVFYLGYEDFRLPYAFFLSKLNGPNAIAPEIAYNAFTRWYAPNGSPTPSTLHFDFTNDNPNDCCPVVWSDMIPTIANLRGNPNLTSNQPNNNETYAPIHKFLQVFNYTLSPTLLNNSNYNIEFTANTSNGTKLENMLIGGVQDLLLEPEIPLAKVTSSNGDWGWTNGTTNPFKFKDDLTVQISNVKLATVKWNSFTNQGLHETIDKMVANGCINSFVQDYDDIYDTNNFLGPQLKSNLVQPFVDDYLSVVNNEIVFDHDVFWNYYGGLNCSYFPNEECDFCDGPLGTVVAIMGHFKNKFGYCEQDITKQCSGSSINTAYLDGFNDPDLLENIISQTFSLNILFDLILTDASSSGNGLSKTYPVSITVVP